MIVKLNTNFPRTPKNTRSIELCILGLITNVRLRNG